VLHNGSTLTSVACQRDGTGVSQRAGSCQVQRAPIWMRTPSPARQLPGKDHPDTLNPQPGGRPPNLGADQAANETRRGRHGPGGVARDDTPQPDLVKGWQMATQAPSGPPGRRRCWRS
jgi:hypothetical protein